MKELAVKNYRTAEGQKFSQDGNEFTVKPIVAQADVDPVPCELCRSGIG